MHAGMVAGEALAPTLYPQPYAEQARLDRRVAAVQAERAKEAAARAQLQAGDAAASTHMLGDRLRRLRTRPMQYDGGAKAAPPDTGKRDAVMTA